MNCNEQIERILTTIQLKRGKYQDIYDKNPILESGEPCFAYDKNILKIGDGTTAYRELPEIITSFKIDKNNNIIADNNIYISSVTEENKLVTKAEQDEVISDVKNLSQDVDTLKQEYTQLSSDVLSVSATVDNIQSDVRGVKDHISKLQINVAATNKTVEALNRESQSQDKRISNLETAVTGTLVQTTTKISQLTTAGLKLPKSVLPYAKLNKIGGITTAVSERLIYGWRWYDVPSDIKYIKSRTANQGAVITDVTSADGIFRIGVKYMLSGQTSWQDISDTVDCSVLDDGQIRMMIHPYIYTPSTGDKIRVKISSTTVKGATLTRANIQPVKITTNASGDAYIMQNPSDYLYIARPIDKDGTFSVTGGGLRMHSEKSFVGDIGFKGYIAGKLWASVDPNTLTNWQTADYYIEATAKQDFGSGVTWTIPLGVFNYDPTEDMTAEEKKAFYPQTDYNKYYLPADYYTPHKEEIIPLPQISKRLHGFNTDYSNWLTFNDNGDVTYTDNYHKYYCNADKYSGIDNSFTDSLVTYEMTGGFAGLVPGSTVKWEYASPTDVWLRSELTEGSMRGYLGANFGYFASRTKSVVDGETITTEKVAENYSPVIPVYDRGALLLLNSDKEPVNGIMSITYQVKLSEITR